MKKRNNRQVASFFITAMMMIFALHVNAAEKNPLRIVRQMITRLEAQSIPVPASLQHMHDRMEKIIKPARTGDCCITFEKIAVNEASTLFEVIEQEWDGSQWQNTWRSEVNQHETHGFIGFLDQEWDGSQWVNRDRMISTLNAQQQIASFQMDEWDGSAWVPVALMLYYYDAQGNQTEEIWQTASDDDGELENFMRQIFTWEDGKLMKTEGYFWEEGAWLKTQETVNDYNSQGLIAEEISYYIIDDQPNISGRNLYTYYASGLLEIKISQSVSYFTQDWVNETKTTYQYHTSGELTADLYQVWDAGIWVDVSLYTAVYNAGGLLTEEVYMDYEEDEWRNRTRTVYTYDANGNNTVETDQTWGDGDWQNDYQYTSAFDANGLPLEETGRYWEDGQWVNDVRWLYNWAFGTSVHEDAAARPDVFVLNNYPNPFNPSTTIHITLPVQDRLSVRIFDLRGRVVKTLVSSRDMHAGVHRIQWDGTDESGRPVSSGIYMYKAEGEKASAAARCMLIK